MKVFIHLLLLFVFNFNTYAFTGEACFGENHLLLDIDLVSASEIVSELKKCPSENSVVLEEVDSKYDKYWGQKSLKKSSVKGFVLAGPKGLHELANQMLGTKPPINWKESAKNCKTILCAFSKLFDSSKAAKQAFNFYSKSGYFLSLDQTINGGQGEQHWNSKEVQELAAAAHKLPSALTGLNLKRIERFADHLRLSIHENLPVAAYASRAPELVFYDAGTRGEPKGPNSYKTTSWSQEVLLHELCHHHDYKGTSWRNRINSEQKNSKFSKLSGWKEKTNESGEPSWIHNKTSGFVSDYAKSSPAEDYAESCMNYILHPNKLKKLAPEKFEYMKTQVFSQEDFLESDWTDLKRLRWDKLKDVIADESGCQDGIRECFSELYHSSERICKPLTRTGYDGKKFTMSNCSKVPILINEDKCMTEYKKKLVERYSNSLWAMDSQFCEQGGASTVEKEQAFFCQKSLGKLQENLVSIKSLDFKSAVDNCESKLNYSEKCVEDQVYKTLAITDEEGKKVYRKLIKDKIPDRMVSLEKKAASIDTSKWMSSCFENIHSIGRFTSMKSGDENEQKLFNYYSSTKGIKAGFLGEYLFTSNAQKNVNFECSKKVEEILKQEGITLPESGNSIELLKGNIKNEIRSFNNEVVDHISEKTKSCLFFQKCKIKRIRKLIDSWIEKSPKSRSDLGKDEFAEKIYNLTK